MAKKRVTAATRHARAKRAGLKAWGGYEAQLARQGGVCCICGAPPKTRKLHVDHNHQAGECRGLICWTCNATLGRAHDNWLRLSTAGAYLHHGFAVAQSYRIHCEKMIAHENQHPL